VDDDHEQRAREQRGRLTGGGLLAKNTVFALLGNGGIIVAQILAVPLLIDRLGVARFGVLTLAWLVIGYAGLFDLGLGRALTKFTAERLGAGRDEEVAGLFWTAIVLVCGLGVIGAVVVAALSPLLVNVILNIPQWLEGESQVAFLLLAASLPVVLVSAALRGNLEARQRFDLTNAIAVPISIVSYFGPVLMTLISPNLALAVSAIVFSRVLAVGINLVLCLRVDPALRHDRHLDRAVVGSLLRFGGWVTAGSILAPLLASVDRFVVGALVSVRGVAYYATPFEAMRQLRVVSMSFSTVLFPAFATTTEFDKQRAEVLFTRGTRGVLIALFPLTFVCVTFAHELLTLWVGPDFARNSTDIMQWLAAGVLVNGAAVNAFSMVQSIRPDLIAKIFLAELPLYLLAFWGLISAFGVEGAAMAYVARVVLDTALFMALLRHLDLVSRDGVWAVARSVALAGAAFLVVVQLDSLAARAAFFGVAMVAFAFLAWYRVLELKERTMLLRRLKLLLR
jgi:O-antigen/teichoic acid export membrane protein